MSATVAKLWIVGAGGFGAEVLHTLRGLSGKEGNGPELAFVDRARAGETFMGLRVLDEEAIESHDSFVVAIGGGEARQAVDNRLRARGCSPFTLRAPTSTIGLAVELGEGAVLSDFTILTGAAVIGRQFQCNIYSYVAHDCIIGDYVTFAPRVCCNGNVQIADHAYIGTGAVLKQGTPDKPVRIGVGAVVGMGAVVTKDVPDGAVVVGNPARLLERSSK